MGIYDREYYRGETGGSGWFSGISPVCKSLIAINVAVFLLDQLINRGDSDPFIWSYLAASPDGTFHHLRLWELLTATFLHKDIWHLLGNMLFLWIVGREMEALYGSRDFLAFYICAAIFSTLTWCLIAAASNVDPKVPMIGASGAVMAVMMLFTLFYPKREIVFFFIPMPIWLLVAIYLFYPLIPVLAHQSSHVAVEAHLAGAGFAFLFKQFDLRWSRLFSGRLFKPRLRIFSPVPREQTPRVEQLLKDLVVGGELDGYRKAQIVHPECERRLHRLGRECRRHGHAERRGLGFGRLLGLDLDDLLHSFDRLTILPECPHASDPEVIWFLTSM